MWQTRKRRGPATKLEEEGRLESAEFWNKKCRDFFKNNEIFSRLFLSTPRDNASLPTTRTQTFRVVFVVRVPRGVCY